MRRPEDLTPTAARTFEELRHHPTTHPVSWDELLTMLGEVADVEKSDGGARAVVRLGNERVELEKPRNGVVAEAPLLELRRMFTEQGLF